MELGGPCGKQYHRPIYRSRSTVEWRVRAAPVSKLDSTAACDAVPELPDKRTSLSGFDF